MLCHYSAKYSDLTPSLLLYLLCNDPLNFKLKLFFIFSFVFSPQIFLFIVSILLFIYILNPQASSLL